MEEYNPYHLSPEKMYAFENRRNGKLISGTNFARNAPPQQMLSDCRTGREIWHTPLILNWLNIDIEIKRRGINLNTYRIVEVEVETRCI